MSQIKVCHCRSDLIGFLSMQTASHALSWYLVPYFYKDCTPQSVKDNSMFIMTVTGNSSPNNRELEVPNMPTSSVCDGIMTTRTTNILRQATRPAAMDFSGTWKVYSEENLEDFLKVIGRNVFYLFIDYFPMYAYIMIFFFFFNMPSRCTRNGYQNEKGSQAGDGD